MGVAVQVGEIGKSVNYGEFQVIELLTKGRVKIKFIQSGFEAEINACEVRRGQVKDWSHSPREWVGKIFPTTTFGDVEILEYINSKNVRVKFLNTGHEDTFSAGNIKKGKILDVMARNSFGIGYIGLGPHKPSKEGRLYHQWISMLERCHSDEHKFRNYFDKSVDESWFCFQNFAIWAKGQRGWNLKGWQLDKDILVKGNNLYCPDNCCFVPHRINSLIIKSNAPLGFWCCKDKAWYFSYREADSRKVRKCFKSREKGVLWYAENKERVVKEVAEIYKNLLDERVYLALISWKAYD